MGKSGKLKRNIIPQILVYAFNPSRHSFKGMGTVFTQMILGIRIQPHLKGKTPKPLSQNIFSCHFLSEYTQNLRNRALIFHPIFPRLFLIGESLLPCRTIHRISHQIPTNQMITTPFLPFPKHNCTYLRVGRYVVINTGSYEVWRLGIILENNSTEAGL